MITPDHGGLEEHRPARRGLLVGVAVLIVFGGLVAIGVATSPETPTVAEDPSPTTTTTDQEINPPIDVDDFTIGQITRGEPLDWELSMAIDDYQPLALLEHDGTGYLFTDSAPLDRVGTGGLRAWRSNDGVNWEPIGEVIPSDHAVTTVDSTAQGLVVTSTRLDDNALVLWESRDAVEWTGSEISADPKDHYRVDVPSAVGANQTTLVVASNRRYDRESLLEDHLLEIGVELELSRLSWNLQWLGEDGHQLVVRAPLGIPLLQQPIDDLDLSAEEREELLGELVEPIGTDLWVRGEDGVWQRGTIGDARSIDSILTSADGRFVAHGPGATRRVVKVSTDGIVWETDTSQVSLWQIEEKRSEFVGGANSSELWISGDGLIWRATGLSELFPSRWGWSMTALGAGDDGAAILMRGSRPHSNLPQPTIQELTTEDGSVFTVDANGPRFQVFSDDGRHRWTLDSASMEQGAIEIDPVGETVTLRDSESGADLATIRFSEIERVEHAHFLSTLLYDFTEALAFTRTGEEWVIQDMAPDIGESASISLLEVTAGRVVAIVRSKVTTLFEIGPPGFEVWSAPLP